MLIRRHVSAASLVTVLITLALGTQVGLAAQSRGSDRNAPQPVRSVAVTAADASSVTIEWSPSRDNDIVAGYGIYVDGRLIGTETTERVTKRRGNDKELLSYTIGQLACGTSYTVGVDVVDRADNRSRITTTTVSTGACADSNPPSTPSGVRQVATTETSVMLAWNASTDNVGVVAYGLYVGGLRVHSVSEAAATVGNLECGKSYLIGIDAADAAGNRSSRVDATFRTSSCPTTNQPPTTPTGLRVTASTQTSVSLAWNSSTDDGSVAGYGLYLAANRTSETRSTSATFSGLTCGTTYSMGVDAFDNLGKRSNIAQLSAATSACESPPPPPAQATLAQTIREGATLAGNVSWRAVYDAGVNGTEDDPGSIRFLVDGTVVHTEQQMPFGDASGFWTSGSVANGRHTFEVRAISDAGAVVVTNSVSASVANDATPPAGDTSAPSVPGGLRVAAATATSVTVAWNASTDNVAVTGYGLYRGAGQTGQTQQTTSTFGGLSCGTAYQIGVDAYDAAGNRSARADLQVTTTPCPDNQPPTAPGNVTATNRTTTSIALTWTASTDNNAVAGYGIYNGGALVNTTTGTNGIVSGLTCGTSYTLAVDAFDMSGNSSEKTAIMVSTLACVDTVAPSVTLTAPTNGSTVSGTLTATANATDNVGVSRVEFFRNGASVGTDSSSPYSIAVNTTTIADGSHTFTARAYDAAGNVGTSGNSIVTVSNAPPSTGSVSQTIANGATLSGVVNWRAVYDSNGDGTEDDPGKVEFRVDGTLVLNELLIPFGDATDFWSSTSVPNGPHTFQVRALTDAGTLLTSNTVTATVANQATTPPPPPPPATGFPNADNTGVPPGTTLTTYSAGSYATTSNGQVIQNLNVTNGCIMVDHWGVVIRNSQVQCIKVRSSSAQNPANPALHVYDVTIVCNNSLSDRGIEYKNFVAERLDISVCENGADINSYVTIRDSYLHDLGPTPVGEAHVDGLQASWGAYSTIEHNTILSRDTSSIAWFNYDGNGTVPNWTITNNLLGAQTSASVAYVIYCPGGTPSNASITNNRFKSQYPPVGGYSTGCNRSGITWSGNVIHETGAPVAAR